MVDAALASLTTPKAFRFKVLACRVFAAYGDNKAKLEVAVEGKEFEALLNVLLEYADSMSDEGSVVREGRAPRGYLERAVGEYRKKSGD